jgi:hypothetical protein
MKGIEYFMSLKTNVVLTEEYNVIGNSEDLIGTTEYLTLWTKFRLKRCRYNWGLLYIYAIFVTSNEA